MTYKVSAINGHYKIRITKYIFQKFSKVLKRSRNHIRNKEMSAGLPSFLTECGKITSNDRDVILLMNLENITNITYDK